MKSASPDSPSTATVAQPTTSPMQRGAFFRQSGWMVFAAVFGGLSMYAVHPMAKFIPKSEYGILGLLLALLNCLAIPAVGLQMVFAQQTAAAVSEEERRRLATASRGVLFGTFVIWGLFAVIALVYQDAIVMRWKISNPLALWITLFIGLGALWAPVLLGLMQGMQNFFWFGWASILNGLGRVAGVAIIVLVFHGYATGMVGGIFAGTAILIGIFAWQTSAVWRGPGAAFDWKPWFARVLPLTLGFGAFQFMFSADPLFVQAYFDENLTGFYTAAGTLARALVGFTVPVVAVMFPKIVRSVASAQRTDVVGLTLIITAAMASCGALSLSLIGPTLLTFIYSASFSAAAGPLLPWFAWSMVPLALANVLVNDLLARSRFEVAPWLVTVAVGYGLAMTVFHDTFLSVIKTLGTFNLLFLVIALFFSWRDRRSAGAAVPVAGAV